MLGVNAGGAGARGRVAGLAAVGTLLAFGAVDEVSAGARAGGGDGAEDGSGGAGGALGGVEGVAGVAVKCGAGVALEGFGGVEVVSGETCAGSAVGVVPKAGLGVAGDAGGRSDGGVEASVGRAAGDTAACAGVVGLSVLRKQDVSVEVLVSSLTSDEGNSNDDISSG